MSKQEAEKRAAAGAAYLDKKLPGWEYDINLRKLDLSEGCQCVLGQLACDIVPRTKWVPKVKKLGKWAMPAFGDAVGTLRIKLKRQQKLGFMSHGEYDEVEGRYVWQTTYPELTAAWRKIIRDRLKVAA